MTKLGDNKPVLVNCGNYFNTGGFNKLCEELEKGNAVEIYIDCIGHTRNAMETRNYVYALHEKYGDRLMRLGSHYDFDTIYMLKGGN